MSVPKVFCIGMYKTGTTSMGKAFERLGLRTFHGSNAFHSPGIDPFAWDAEAFRPHLRRAVNHAHLFDAFEDYPYMFIFREMHEAFPDARFILTERDPIKLAHSDINMLKQYGRTDIPPFEVFVQRYERHHAAVLEHFGNSDQLLRMRLGAGQEWERLCDFLELPVPRDVPFPRSNKRPYGTVGRWLVQSARWARDVDRSTRGWVLGQLGAS